MLRPISKIQNNYLTAVITKTPIGIIHQTKIKEKYFIKNMFVENNMNFEILLPNNFYIDDIYKLKDNYLCRNGNTAKPFIIDFSNKGLIFIDNFEYEIGLEDGMNEGLKPIIKTSLCEVEGGIFDFNKNKLLWSDKNKINLKVCNENLFSINDVIEKYDIHTGLLQWQFDVSTIEDNLRVNKIIGICNGVLIASYGDGANLGINIKDGSFLWKFENHSGGENVYIDENNHKIIGLTPGLYWEININTGELIKQINIYEMCKKNNIESQRENFAIVHNHIITTDWRQGVIGAFNTQTHQFDWIHKEEGVSFPSGSPIKYIEPYLFVQDNKNTLHIFEKE